MALINLKFYSEALGMQTEVYAAIPQRRTLGEIGVRQHGTEEKYKCLYLLHGLSDDHSIWLRRTSVERYAADYGICVVMPAAAKSYYTDMKYGQAYYTYIAKELPMIIREFLNVSDKREDNFVAGLSMGGYGALKIGLREADRFCAAAGLSPAADITHLTPWPELAKPIFGDPPVYPDDDNLFTLAKKHENDETRCRFYMAIGLSDSLRGETLRLKDTLSACRYDLTYEESPGDHNWEFWDAYIQRVLHWMLAET